jgi:hypothetical protein
MTYMGRKNRKYTQESMMNNTHDMYHDEISSTGEISSTAEEIVELEENLENVPPLISTTGHMLPDHPVQPENETIDAELTVGIEDVNNRMTENGDVAFRRNAHEVAGARQSTQARHAAFKRLLGLSEEDKTLSPASPHKKQ